MRARTETTAAPDAARDTRNTRSSRWRMWSTFALATAGGLLIFYGGLLVLRGSLAHWGWSKAAGQIIRLAGGQQGGPNAPVVVFADAEGRSHTVFMGQFSPNSRYAVGDAVAVLYDPADPSQAHIRGFREAFAVPLFLASAGALLLLIAATISSPPESLREFTNLAPQLPPDAPSLQFHPFNAVSVKHYLAEAGAPDAARKVKITDAAQALAQGRYPVALAELLAYASALAYRSDAAEYVAHRIPRVSNAAQVEHSGAHALMFLLEGQAVIAIAETRLARLPSQIRQLFARRAGPRALVPSDTVWDAAPRDRAPAAVWHELRDAVEAWCKTVSPEGSGADEHKPPRVLFTGHGAGGALAVLAAYEFAKRGRVPTAIVTFGAPPVAGRGLAAEYVDLGLDVRTLDVRAPRAALRHLRWPWSQPVPALRWTLPASGFPPRAAAANGMKSSPWLARFAHARLAREEARGLDKPRSLVMSLVLRLLSGSAAARTAMLRHDIERRYAIPLTLMVRERLLEVLGADHDAVSRALSDHLLDIRGVRPEDAHLGFLTLDGIPADGAAPGMTATAGTEPRHG